MQNPDQSIFLEMDFLPAKYREESANRKSAVWRVMLMVFCAGLVGSMGLFQYRTRLKLQADLVSLAPRFDVATAQSTRYAQLQSDLKKAEAQADLVTFLRNPWPRTQVLYAVLADLPKTVVLSELLIAEETATTRSSSEASSRRRSKSDEDKELEKLEPPERDLKKLREKQAGKVTIVSLSGSTNDVSALHTFLSRVTRSRLIAKAQIQSIDGGTRASSKSVFHIRLVIVSGYGLPGGPEGPTEEVAPTSDKNRVTESRDQDGEPRSHVGSST